jgi:hypothetical protein
VKDDNGDLLADSHNILNRWKNYFSQLLDVHRVSDVRQIEIQEVLNGNFKWECKEAVSVCYKVLSQHSFAKTEGNYELHQ